MLGIVVGCIDLTERIKMVKLSKKLIFFHLILLFKALLASPTCLLTHYLHLNMDKSQIIINNNEGFICDLSNVTMNNTDLCVANVYRNDKCSGQPVCCVFHYRLIELIRLKSQIVVRPTETNTVVHGTISGGGYFYMQLSVTVISSLSAISLLVCIILRALNNFKRDICEENRQFSVKIDQQPLRRDNSSQSMV